jgi:hypothetical protein
LPGIPDDKREFGASCSWDPAQAPNSDDRPAARSVVPQFGDQSHCMVFLVAALTGKSLVRDALIELQELEITAVDRIRG